MSHWLGFLQRYFTPAMCEASCCSFLNDFFPQKKLVTTQSSTCWFGHLIWSLTHSLSSFPVLPGGECLPGFSSVPSPSQDLGNRGMWMEQAKGREQVGLSNFCFSSEPEGLLGNEVEPSLLESDFVSCLCLTDVKSDSKM